MAKKKTATPRRGKRTKDITLKAGQAAALRGGAWYAKFDGVDGSNLKVDSNEMAWKR